MKREGLKKHIYQIYIKSQKQYRSLKITQILRSHGYTVTQRTVSRLMKEFGIRSITKKKYKTTTHSKHRLPVYPHWLNQQFKLSQPDSVWASEITYVYTKEGWWYLATVMDLFSHSMSTAFGTLFIYFSLNVTGVKYYNEEWNLKWLYQFT